MKLLLPLLLLSTWPAHSQPTSPAPIPLTAAPPSGKVCLEPAQAAVIQAALTRFELLKQAYVANIFSRVDQFKNQPARTVAAIMPAKHPSQHLFPSKGLLATCLLLSLLPRILAASWHRYYLAKQAHRTLIPLRFDKEGTVHSWLWSACAHSRQLAMAFFKF